MARKTKTTIEGSVLTFSLLDAAGEAVENLVCDVSKLAKEIQQNLLMHGAKQKVQDAAAGADNPESAKARMQAVIEQLASGTWVAAREGGGGSRTTKLAKALARMYKIKIVDAEKKLVDLDDEQVAALRKHPKVKAVMAQISAEDAAAKAKAADEGDEGEGEDALAAFTG